VREVRVLRLQAGEQGLALDVEQVRATGQAGPVTRLPWAPVYVWGVAEVGGDVVPLIDLAARLGLPPTPRSEEPPTVVVVESREPAALVVSRILGVEVLRGLHELGPAGLVAGVRARHAGLVLLEGERLVDGRPLKPLSEVLDSGAGEEQVHV